MLFAAAPSPSAGTVYQLLRDLGASDGTAHTVQSLSIGPLRIAVVLLLISSRLPAVILHDATATSSTSSTEGVS